MNFVKGIISNGINNLITLYHIACLKRPEKVLFITNKMFLNVPSGILRKFSCSKINSRNNIFKDNFYVYIHSDFKYLC